LAEDNILVDDRHIRVDAHRLDGETPNSKGAAIARNSPGFAPDGAKRAADFHQRRSRRARKIVNATAPRQCPADHFHGKAERSPIKLMKLMPEKFQPGRGMLMKSPAAGSVVAPGPSEFRSTGCQSSSKWAPSGDGRKIARFRAAVENKGKWDR